MSNLRQTIATRFVLVLQGNYIASLEREDGQTLAEYALILATIALVVVTAVVLFAGSVSSLFSTAAHSI